MSGARVGSDWFVGMGEKMPWTMGLSQDLARLTLRAMGVGLAVAHGWPKFSALTGGSDRFIASVASLGFPLPFVFAWAATLSELLGGTLVALGLFTRVAALFAACTMTVAAFLRHRFHFQALIFLGVIEVPEETVESWGNPERAIVYLAVFLALILLGPGRFSLDHIFRHRS